MVKSRSVFEAMLLTQFLLVPMFAFAPQASVEEALGSNTLAFQKGMSYATYANMVPDAFGSAESDESLRRMKQIGVEWVAINVVGWYQTNAYSVDIHKNPKQTPTDDALIHVIQSAHDLGMKVMLKPMIDLEDGRWRGEIRLSEPWFQNYSNYINLFAEFAQQQNVEMFCIGTEYKSTTSWTPQWRDIISGVRSRFHGKITYAASWDEFSSISWWNDLDYVGIDAYFPLSSRNDPSIVEMKAIWANIASFLESFYQKVEKPIIFSEIGYLSTDGTNKDPSNYKLQEIPGRLIDLQEQTDCYEAAFQTLWNQTWLHGFYWWYWQTDPNAGGSNNSDYTPQNKPAQGVITHWYSLNWYPVPDYAEYSVWGLSLVAAVEAAMIGVLWKRRKTVPKG